MSAIQTTPPSMPHCHGCRTLETIFEETCDKDGALLRIGHQRRRRLLLFPDCTQPRKRKRQGMMGNAVLGQTMFLLSFSLFLFFAFLCYYFIYLFKIS